jgi:transcription-repair coupling factor (superfamily II helicase)
MSLAGIRDMSVIETPPRDRLSIQTHVVKFDQDVIRRAIGTELERGGQVYFVHNRVESIFSIANLLSRLVPDVRIGIGHGQMGDEELERVMVDFVSRKFDILVATTIIENGLDIPNANTIIINRADRYGLSQLYQLRGRVGRADRRAYAYLLVPPTDALSPIARKRLAAIREFSDLGSGFRVAALDLEIRGAGNLLGGEQSGQIEAVGFDMYMKLLEETVKTLKGEDLDDDRRATVNLRLDFRIDDDVIGDMNQRLSVYRRMAGVRSLDELERLLEELRDRYGPPSASILNLAEFARLRILADGIGLESVERDGKIVMLKFRPDTKLDPAWLFTAVKARGDLTLLPPAILKLDLNRPSDPPETASRAELRSKKRQVSPTASWWTTRARAGEVTPGFSREVILAPGALDPRAPGGLFERLGDVLTELGRGIKI